MCKSETREHIVGGISKAMNSDLMKWETGNIGSITAPRKARSGSTVSSHSCVSRLYYMLYPARSEIEPLSYHTTGMQCYQHPSL